MNLLTADLDRLQRGISHKLDFTRNDSGDAEFACGVHAANDGTCLVLARAGMDDCTIARQSWTPGEPIAASSGVESAVDAAQAANCNHAQNGLAESGPISEVDKGVGNLNFVRVGRHSSKEAETRAGVVR